MNACSLPESEETSKRQDVISRQAIKIADLEMQIRALRTRLDTINKIAAGILKRFPNPDAEPE